MTFEELLAEVKNKLKTYAAQNLIDPITVKANMKECLQEFGGNLMEQHQVTLPVENGRVMLPSNFWALKAAVKCEQAGYTEEKTEKHIQRRISYLEWTSIDDYFNYIEGKPCKDDEDSKYITETLFFETPKKAYTFYYNNPTQLRLIPHSYKVRCDNNCPNLTTNSPYEISIDEKHNFISTNFNEGFVWLWYKGLPSDDRGELMIPETSNDKLKNYIVYFVIVKVLEDLWLSEDDPNVINKIQYFTEKSNEYYYLAKSTSISKGLLGWKERVVNNNRRFMNKFENIFGNL